MWEHGGVASAVREFECGEWVRLVGWECECEHGVGGGELFGVELEQCRYICAAGYDERRADSGFE